MTESAEQVYKRALSEMKKEQWLAAIKLLEGEVAVVQKNCGSLGISVGAISNSKNSIVPESI